MYIEALEKYGTKAKAARALGIPRTTFRRRLAKEGKQQKPSTIVTKPKGLTEEELLLKVSPEHQILHAAQNIPEGRFIPEQEFIHNLRIHSGYKHIVEKPKFIPYRGRAAGNDYYWACEESMAKMKNEGILS